MNVKTLLGELAVNVAAGFADELAHRIERDAAGVAVHPHARGIGRQLAHTMLDESPKVLKGELLDTTSLADDHIEDAPDTGWNQQVVVTPELLAAFRAYKTRRNLP